MSLFFLTGGPFISNSAASWAGGLGGFGVAGGGGVHGTNPFFGGSRRCCKMPHSDSVQAWDKDALEFE